MTLTRVKRPTIRDIAREAGVSPGAVSFALNGRPGVSEQTRERIHRIARAQGWTPNATARALSSRQAFAIGLVIARPPDSVSGEGFFLRFIAGIERILTAESYSLLLQMVSTPEQEMQAHRAWWSGQRVDGVVLTDLRDGDARPAHLARLAIPAVVVGVRPQGAGGDGGLLSTVVADDAAAMRQVVEHLHEAGCRRVAHVSGLADLTHTQVRRSALAEAAGERGLDVVAAVITDFTEDAGGRATRDLLTGPEPGARPDAIVYDSEILALGGLMAVHDLGRRVPDDVALVSFEDSTVCRVVDPPLTALHRDPADLGADAAEALLDLIATAEPVHRVATPPSLVVRGSTSGPTGSRLRTAPNASS